VFSVEVSATVDLDHALACFLDCLVTKTVVKNHQKTVMGIHSDKENASLMM